MSVQNANAVTYAELTDEHIADIKKGIEMFVKENEYWDKFVHHTTVPRGHKTFQSRQVIEPIVKESDITERAEFIAPRTEKIAIRTFERTVKNYGTKSIYSREGLQYNIDNEVQIIRATLQSRAVKMLDFIKGKPFVSSRAIVEPVVVTPASGSAYESILETAEEVAITFRKNHTQRWDGGLYLAHITPEGLKQLRKEIAAKGDRLSEPTKKELDGRTYEYYSYGDFNYSVTSHDLMYFKESPSNTEKQYVIFMGRREADNESPIDVAKLEGESNIELINNPLGTGLLKDVDDNYTSDDNKQQGSVAINMDGLGACISDDLCVIRCAFSLKFVSNYVYENNDHPAYDVTGGKDMVISKSGNGLTYGVEWTISKSAGTNTAITLSGVDANNKAKSGAYVKATVAGASGYHLANGVPTRANWSATFDSTKKAKIVAFLDNNKSVIVEVPSETPTTATLTIACAATGTAD